MVRNTGPAKTAPRWPEPRDGHGAQRPDPRQYAQPAPGEPPTQPPQGYDPYAAQQPAAGYPAQPGAYPHDGYPAAPAHHDTGQYAQPQSTAYAPQFEPYQPPPPQQHAQPGQQVPTDQQWAQQHWPEPGQPPQQGWEQAPQIAPHPHQQHHYEQQNYEQHHYQQSYDPAAYAREAQQHGYQQAHQPQQAYQQQHAAYQPPAQQHEAPHLRGPAYDQGYAPQPEWTEQAGYAQEPSWGDQPTYDPSAYQHPSQGYDAAGQYQPAEPYAYGDPAAAGYQQGHYAPDPGFGPAEPGFEPPAQHDPGYDEDYDAEELAYEGEAGGGRGRFVKIAAAIALAIGIGGGLAYGYKSLMGPDRSGKPPVVRTADAPAKVKPDDPGGKQFAHTNSKVLGRLGQAGSQPAEDKDEAGDGSGTRKVSTMVIGRDGSIVTPPAAERPPPSSLPPSVSPVPGMTIVDGFAGRQPRVSAEPPSSTSALVNGATAAPPAAEPAKPAEPIVISRAEPTPPPARATQPPPKPAAQAPKPQPERRVARTEPAPAPSAPRAPASASGAGYVAVLASIPRSGSSRMDALKQFADLQQKYAAQLGGKTPDVQEANLGAKGTYHRLIVGPPGSRQQASSLCSELKSAGYSSCWIKSY